MMAFSTKPPFLILQNKMVLRKGNMNIFWRSQGLFCLNLNFFSNFGMKVSSLPLILLTEFHHLSYSTYLLMKSSMVFHPLMITWKFLDLSVLPHILRLAGTYSSLESSLSYFWGTLCVKKDYELLNLSNFSVFLLWRCSVSWKCSFLQLFLSSYFLSSYLSTLCGLSFFCS